MANDGDTFVDRLRLNVNDKKEGKKKQIEGMNLGKVELVVLTHSLKISVRFLYFVLFVFLWKVASMYPTQNLKNSYIHRIL